MEAIKYNTIQTKALNDILSKAELDIETDMVGVDFEEDGFYLYAFIYFDNSVKDIAFMIDGSTIELTEKQKEYVFDFLLEKASNNR
ncbi:hypothetical protein [Tenacibaculum sp. 190524A05c]|uniref:hypothetical protein n=1 Tax=Tenacibaculum platacis TaxID=3137852 RepID=UPI0031FA8549